MDKYKRLMSNTMLFAISTFSSKVLSFFLTSYHTHIMGTESYGAINVVIYIGNLLIPVVSLGISNAVIRYGIQKGISKKAVYTNGIIATFMGFLLLLALTPLLSIIPFIGGNVQGYWPLLLVFVLVSCLRTLNCQIVRAKEAVRLYAFDGILATATNLGFNILFLSGFEIRPDGILLATICSDACSTVFLFCVSKLWRYIDFRKINRPLFKKMLVYSLPLIPTSVFWWVTNVSDQLFVTHYWGDGATGIYAASYKIPTLISIVATLFTEAWQLSAFTDGQEKGREEFFTKVFGAYQGLMFLAGGGLILLCKPIMTVFVSSAYFEGWRYIPVLIAAMIFSSLNNYLNSIYMLMQKSKMSLYTMALGAISNILLNWLLIPRVGVMGAAVATFISYLLVFIVRVYSTHKLIAMEYSGLRLAVNLAAVVLESLIVLLELKLWWLWSAILCAVILVINFGALWNTVMKLLRKRL